MQWNRKRSFEEKNYKNCSPPDHIVWHGPNSIRQLHNPPLKLNVLNRRPFVAFLSDHAVCVIFLKLPFAISQHLSPFWQERPFDSGNFQMCFIRIIIAYLCPNINVDVMDFSKRRSEEVISFFWSSSYVENCLNSIAKRIIKNMKNI